MSLCKSCGNAIMWVKTETGKAMPLDGKKVTGGNVEVVGGIAHIVRPDGTERYVSHFAHCPQAGEHRKTK